MHGLSRHPLYNTYKGILQRCYYEKAISYPYYGKRGIRMCDEWLNDINKFIEWALKNGWRKGLQVDRISGDGHYSEQNCRIVTRMQNELNKKYPIKIIEFNGQSHSMGGWDKIIGLPKGTIQSRLSRGWGFKKAISEPLGPHGSRKGHKNKKRIKSETKD